MIEYENLPSRIAKLPRNELGYPIPWFVAYVDGKPEFRAMDQQKWLDALQFSKCWVCGEKLGIHKTFVAGPMCGINRTSSEPPSHKDCAEWSAKNCPFLSNPSSVRRECPHINRQTMNEKTPGIALTRNPGVTMLWHTKGFDLFPDGKGNALFFMHEPEAVDWYCEGRIATRQEVQHSVDTGYPALLAIAKLQPGAMKALDDMTERFLKFLPKE